MASIDLELQGAIIQRLKADPAVTALVAGRIYDAVPQGVVFPYVTYGPTDALEDDADCIRALDIDIQLDVWSRGVGFPEAKKIAAAVADALHQAELVLPTNAFVFIEHRQTSMRRDPDGLTSHGLISLNSVVEYP